MNDFKFLLLCNFLIDAIIVIGVTIAAIEFQNSNLLWWYILLCVTGYGRTRISNDDE